MTLDEAVKIASEKYKNKWFGSYYEDDKFFYLFYLHLPGYLATVGGHPVVFVSKQTGEVSENGHVPFRPWEGGKYKKNIPGTEEKWAEIEKMREAELNDTDD